MTCKWEHSWMEDVVGDGGPRMEMSDCTNPGDIGEGSCGKDCYGYEEGTDPPMPEMELDDAVIGDDQEPDP